MIQLHPDCLLFQTSNGESIPCSAEIVTIELVGDGQLDPRVVREAAAAVVFYFRNELGKESVSIEEFARALERVLRNLGYKVTSGDDGAGEEVEASAPSPAAEYGVSATGEFLPAPAANLPELASASGKGFELFFFQRLRTELRARLITPARTVHFQGLRTCVKQLTGRQRWCPTCQKMEDQIVDYLRECFTAENAGDCNLVVL